MMVLIRISSIGGGWSRAILICVESRLAKEFVAYVGGSVLALMADLSSYWLALMWGVPYMPAAAIGFLNGLVVAYLFSIRWVFSVRRVSDARVEFIAFMIIGFGGLVLGELMLYLAVTELHFSAIKAKLYTIPVVFVFNFILRKLTLFVSTDFKG
jgi:putative flippase GtrA